MKRVKADRLLHFDCRKPRPFRLDIAHLYVALPPELIHVFFLLSQQTGETLTDNPIQGPVRAARHLVGVFSFRGVVHYVLCQMKGTAWFGFNGEDNLTGILSVIGLVFVWTVGFKVVIYAASQDHVASLSLVDEHDATVSRTAGAWLDLPRKLRLARVFCSLLLSGHPVKHLRGNHHRRRCIQSRHLIRDRRDVTLLKGNQTPGLYPHKLS